MLMFFLRRWRFLLFPFSFLYALGFWLLRCWGRRGAWQAKGIKTLKIGNLSTGGTGKTPHTAYLVEVLAAYFSPIAVVSRGYGRKTRQMICVAEDNLAADVGDEPLWLKRQLPDTLVIVARQRREGLEWLQKNFPRCSLAILDDAMQHWALQADAEILLTAYDAPFFEDYWLPAGNLREGRSGAQRAAAIIVSQCPPKMSEQARADCLARIRVYNACAPVFFSFYNYQNPYALGEVAQLLPFQMLAQSRIILLTAIARPAALLDFAQENAAEVLSLAYADHHAFSAADIDFIGAEALRWGADLLLTTEKDAQRLLPFAAQLRRLQIAVFVLPIQVCFYADEGEQLRDFLLSILGAAPAASFARRDKPREG